MYMYIICMLILHVHVSSSICTEYNSRLQAWRAFCMQKKITTGLLLLSNIKEGSHYITEEVYTPYTSRSLPPHRVSGVLVPASFLGLHPSTPSSSPSRTSTTITRDRLLTTTPNPYLHGADKTKLKYNTVFIHMCIRVCFHCTCIYFALKYVYNEKH